MHAHMVLLHGRTPTGAQRIAACRADARKDSQLVFRPDWNCHRKATPFERNSRMLEVLPIGIIVFTGQITSMN